MRACTRADRRDTDRQHLPASKRAHTHIQTHTCGQLGAVLDSLIGFRCCSCVLGLVLYVHVCACVRARVPTGPVTTNSLEVASKLSIMPTPHFRACCSCAGAVCCGYLPAGVPAPAGAQGSRTADAAIAAETEGGREGWRERKRGSGVWCVRVCVCVWREREG
jgi:hypothetical protein